MPSVKIYTAPSISHFRDLRLSMCMFLKMCMHTHTIFNSLFYARVMLHSATFLLELFSSKSV